MGKLDTYADAVIERYKEFGRVEQPHFCIPMFVAAVGWMDDAVKLTSYPGPSNGGMPQFHPMTLEAARRDVAKVKAGKSFHNLTPNCIVRVYLKPKVFTDG